MKKLIEALVLVVALVSIPRAARPVETGSAGAAPGDTASSAAPYEVTPPTPPPDSPPPPPSDSAQLTPSNPIGQWVYTSQYGWVFMPYAKSYTYAPVDGSGEPYMYVYYPAGGWSWVVAPWLWGWGPAPYFGIHGGWRFAWFGHGWGFGWRGYRPVAFRYGVPFHGFRPTPFHAGFGHPVFVGRGGFAFHR